MKKIFGWFFYLLPIPLVVFVTVPTEYLPELLLCLLFTALMGASVLLGVHLLDGE